MAQENTTNKHFTPSEVLRIGKGFAAVSDAVRKREDITPEKIDYITRKLDEIVEAANRVGRKDWVNLAIGTLTNDVIGAAVGPNATKFLFQTVSQALEWILGGHLKLLS